MEHSTCPLTFTDQSKRQSSRFFAKRESRQTKLRLQVSSLDAAQPSHSQLAVPGSESSLLSYLVSSTDWTENKRASKSKRPSTANGNIISIILSRTRGGRPSLFNCGGAANFPTCFTFSLCSSGHAYCMNSRNGGRRWLKAACWMTSRHSTALSG